MNEWHLGKFCPSDACTFMSLMVVLGLVKWSIEATCFAPVKRLAGKIISEMSYIVSSGTMRPYSTTSNSVHCASRLKTDKDWLCDKELVWFFFSCWRTTSTNCITRITLLYSVGASAAYPQVDHTCDGLQCRSSQLEQTPEHRSLRCHTCLLYIRHESWRLIANFISWL